MSILQRPESETSFLLRSQCEHMSASNLRVNLTRIFNAAKKETVAASNLSAKYIAVSCLFNESALHVRQSPSLEKTNYV